MSRWMNGWVNEWMTGGWLEGRTNGWTNLGRMVKWKDHVFWSHVGLGSNPSTATYWLYILKQVTQPL